jgi:hypothetical protein
VLVLAFTDQRFVGQTLAFGHLRSSNKAGPVLILTFVEAKDLLLDVALQMLGARGNVRPPDRPREHREERFDAVRVNVAANILKGVVVNGFVNLVALQATVGGETVRVNQFGSW